MTTTPSKRDDVNGPERMRTDNPINDLWELYLHVVAKWKAVKEERDRYRAALLPLAECHLPPEGYEHLGVTAHFSTEQIRNAKEALHPPTNPIAPGSEVDG